MLKEYSETITSVRCVVCRRLLMERSKIPYRPLISKDLLGPGSMNTATERDRVVLGYHCPGCGIDYHQLPSGGDP
jgi:hypothetical protein